MLSTSVNPTAYDATEHIINPSKVITIGELLDKYFAYAEKMTRTARSGEEHRNFHLLR
jgi:hypothetical protein